MKTAFRPTTLSIFRAEMYSLLVLVVLSIGSGAALAQSHLERDGLVVYWGVLPPAVVWDKRAPQTVHGPNWRDDRSQHLMVAVFNSDGSRIEDAAVRVQVMQPGRPAGESKSLTPMKVGDQLSYGEVFPVVRAGPYRFRIFVKVPTQAREIELVARTTLLHHEN